MIVPARSVAGGAVAERTAYRRARRAEARKIAEPFRVCSGGVADYVWHGLPGAGDTPLEVGARRYAREDGGSSYRNCLIAERGGAVAGMLHAYPIDAGPDEEDDAPDPVLRPYAELEVPGSLYTSGMAVFPACRNLGIGAGFLAHARERARAEGLKTLSALIFEHNAGSLKLFKRNGFAVVDRRPVVAHELLEYGGDVLLLAAPL